MRMIRHPDGRVSLELGGKRVRTFKSELVADQYLEESKVALSNEIERCKHRITIVEKELKKFQSIEWIDATYNVIN